MVQKDATRVQDASAAYAREVAELFASSRRSIDPAQLDAAARSSSGSFSSAATAAGAAIPGSAFARVRSASAGGGSISAAAAAPSAPQLQVRLLFPPLQND